MALGDILCENHIGSRPICEELKIEFSWFSILWVSQKKNVQFLSIYKFKEHEKTDIQIIGLLTYKLEKESFWLSPALLDC
jgi:hypothetical protein